MNILKALEGLSANQGGNDTDKTTAPPPTPASPPPAETLNVMASVLERHEQIANRVRNKK